MQIGIVAFGFALAMAGALPATAQEWASSYTRHDYAKCRKARADEGDVSVRRCPGKAGIAVTWTAGDDSSLVEFGTSPTQETPSGSAAFFEAGSTIEWRGPEGGKPQAAILRYATGQSIGKFDGSLLVVYRLGADGASCIIGSIDGRGGEANMQARRLADEKAASFRCGQDRRSDR